MLGHSAILSPAIAAGNDPASGRHAQADSRASSIFAQNWWLDAAAPGAWDRVEVRWHGTTVGSMSFAVARRAGLRFIQLPPLTRTLSPLLRPPGGSPAHLLVNRVRILDELLQQLPSHDRFELSLQPGCDSALPFVMLNYAVAHTYTFVVSEAGDLRRQMHQKTRNVVNKAARDFQVVATDDPDRFLHLMQLQRGAGLQQDIGTVRRMYNAAHARQQAMVLCAVNERNQDGGGAILLWDESRLYFWLSARNPAESSNGAVSLLITQAAERAISMRKVFDIDGFGNQRSAEFLAKFGFSPIVRPYVNHGTRMWKFFHLISSSLRGVRDDRHYRF